MNPKLFAIFAASVLIARALLAQDAKVVADNLEFSREFYSGVHFSAIAESKPSFGYQRYPDNGPERIQCDQGTFARKQHGTPWLKSEDWGESGRPVLLSEFSGPMRLGGHEAQVKISFSH